MYRSTQDSSSQSQTNESVFESHSIDAVVVDASFQMTHSPAAPTAILVAKESSPEPQQSIHSETHTTEPSPSGPQVGESR